MSKNSKTPSRKSTAHVARDFVARVPCAFLFPLKPGCKKPPMFKDELEANNSNDPQKLKFWHDKYAGCNWGIALKKAKLIVMDVDTKPGKSGQATFDDLEMMYGSLSETFTVRTPSGGLHLYFKEANGVEHRMGVSAFGRDVDSPNYVLAPGCVLSGDGKDVAGEYVIINDVPIADAPAWFKTFLDKPTAEPVEQVPEVELDQDANVEWAVSYLQNDAPSSRIGENGEYTVLLIYGELKDHGISMPKAIELFEQHYNTFEHCDPPWNLGDGPIADRHDVKAQNAYSYLKENAPGAATPEAEFTAEPLTAEQEADVKRRAAEDWKQYNERLARERPEDMAAFREGADKTTMMQLAPLDSKEPRRIGLPTTLCNEWVWATGIERFIKRREPGVMWKVKQFDSVFNPIARTGSISSQLFKTDFPLRRFKTMIFAPGKPETTDGNYNGWRGSPIKPAKGDTTLWNQHLGYVFPGDAERNEVLNWCAWVLQNPSAKPDQALLIVGKNTGTGKSLIARVMEQLVGPANTQRPKNSSLGGDFNSWLLSCRLCVIEELMQVGRRENLNALRDIITEPFVEVNIKGVPAYKIPNYVAMLGITNSPDALPIDSTDRRWDIVSVPDSVTAKPKAYYDALFAVTVEKDKPMTPVREAGLAAIYYELLKRDLKGWAPRGHAVMTDAKRDMIARAEPAFTRWLREQIDGEPFTWELINIRDDILSLPIPEDVRPRGVFNMDMMVVDFLKTELHAGKFLDASGGEARHRIGGKDGPKRTLWGINGGAEKYANMPPAERVAAYLKVRDPYRRVVRKAEVTVDLPDE